MLAMEEPKLEQFGLNKGQYDYLARNKNKSHKLITILSVIIGWGLFVIVAWRENSGQGIWPRVIISAVIALFPGSVAALFMDRGLWHLYVNMRNKFSKNYQKLNLYEAAHEDYVDWWNRTQESFWKSLSGKEFESELALLYSKLGYQVDFPQEGGPDKGIDFIIKKNGKIIIVQCKAQKTPIGPHVIRDLQGTMINSNADEAILASISGFTSGVKEYAQGKPISLVSLDDIIRMRRLIPQE